MRERNGFKLTQVEGRTWYEFVTTSDKFTPLIPDRETASAICDALNRCQKNWKKPPNHKEPVPKHTLGQENKRRRAQGPNGCKANTKESILDNSEPDIMGDAKELRVRAYYDKQWQDDCELAMQSMLDWDRNH